VLASTRADLDAWPRWSIQIVRGVTNSQVGQYLAWYLLPLTLDMAILAILAVFVQALSPNKYVGWGIMVIYLVGDDHAGEYRLRASAVSIWQHRERSSFRT
jgi:hypothetical protein